MRARGKIIVLAVVLVAGYLAALAHRRPAAERTEELEVAARPAEIVLQVRQDAQSPAASLYDEERPAAANPAPFTGRVERPPVLTPPSAPPSLPAKFEPLLPPIDALLGRNWARPLAEIHGAAASPYAEPVTVARRHRLTDGDTLAELARRYLGNADRADEIFAANADLLRDPAVLPLGVEIVIPPAGAPQQSLIPVPPESE